MKVIFDNKKSATALRPVKIVSAQYLTDYRIKSHLMMEVKNK